MGPVVAGVVVIAAAVLALFLVRRKRAKKQPQKVIMEDAFAVTRVSFQPLLPNMAANAMH